MFSVFEKIAFDSQSWKLEHCICKISRCVCKIWKTLLFFLSNREGHLTGLSMLSRIVRSHYGTSLTLVNNIDITVLKMSGHHHNISCTFLWMTSLNFLPSTTPPFLIWYPLAYRDRHGRYQQGELSEIETSICWLFPCRQSWNLISQKK